MMGPMVVKQTATELTIERTQGEAKVVSTYKLDGTESVNKMMGRGGEVETKSTAKWDGAKLVISTQRPGPDGAMMTQAQTWSLEGGNLVIERPGRVAYGLHGRGGIGRHLARLSGEVGAPVEAQMDVAVDQPRRQGLAASVDLVRRSR